MLIQPRDQFILRIVLSQPIIEQFQEIGISGKSGHFQLRGQHFCDRILVLQWLHHKRRVSRTEEAARQSIVRMHVNLIEHHKRRQVARAWSQFIYDAAVHREFIAARCQSWISCQPVERRLRMVARLIHGRDRTNDRIFVGPLCHFRQ